jgi:hypothetical protein
MKLDAGKSDTIEYLDPVVPRKADSLTVPAVEYLSGKWIGFLENGWKSFSKISVRLEELLKHHHGIAGFRRYKISSSGAPPQALFDQVVAECDGAIVGLAN